MIEVTMEEEGKKGETSKRKSISPVLGDIKCRLRVSTANWVLEALVLVTKGET